MEGNVGYVALSRGEQGTGDEAGYAAHQRTVTPVSLGFNTGYQFNRFIAGELGFNYFFASQVKNSGFNAPFLGPTQQRRTMWSDIYALTLAAKLSLPISTTTNLYGKLGIAYAGATEYVLEDLDAPGHIPVERWQNAYHTSMGDISPMFGAGLQMQLTDTLYGQVGWMTIPSRDNACTGRDCTRVKRPAINAITAGLGGYINPFATKHARRPYEDKWYLEGNVGYVLLNPIKQNFNGAAEAPHSQTTTPLGIGVNTGYQFNPFIAAELGFNYFFASQKNSQPNSDTFDILTDLYALTIAAKTTLPINTVVSMYGKLGLAYAGIGSFYRPSSSNRPLNKFATDISPLFGAGLQVNLSNSLYAQLGWMMIPGKESSCTSSYCPPVGRPMINEITAGFGAYMDTHSNAAKVIGMKIKKWYAEGNVGYVLLSPRRAQSTFFDFSHKNATNITSPIGLGFNTGYQFNPFIATELGFNYFFISQEQPGTDHSQRPRSISLTDMYAFTLAEKASLPINSALGIYGKLGVAYTRATQHGSTFNIQTSSSVGDFTPLFGAGFQANLSENFYAQLGWLMIPGKQSACTNAALDNFDFCPISRPMINEITGGIGYRFG
jgi:opacity protein-like surface antigen